ncbi:MAG: O-antigen ligase family protein [Clostridiales bacterium]|nr:O-antigen ligase family protein [Clostridiales bacterium]
MSDVSAVLTKKDYLGEAKRLSDGSVKEFDRKVWYKVLYVFLIILSSIGEWTRLNVILAGLPKAITAGVIALAFLCFLLSNDLDLVKSFVKPYMAYVSLILVIMLWSLIIWVLDFTSFSSIIRGGSKMAFQLVSITAAVCAVYIFGQRAVYLLFLGLSIMNGTIMLLEMPNYGVGESLRSLWVCVSTFGTAEGYARSLEIHDVTFLFGQFIIYFLLFAPRGTEKEKKERRFGIIVSIFFFAVGLKRVAVIAIVASLIYGFIVLRRKNITKIVITGGVLWFLFLFVYLYSVRTGSFIRLMDKVNFDMMGREYIWELAKKYYRFEPSYMGLGFEAVDAIVKGWYESGILTHAYPFHNDILKVFVELGFPGFCLWAGITYIVYPVFFCKHFSPKAGVLYMSLLTYMTFTYMTDNTAFYFWCTMGLRLIPLAYAFGTTKHEKVEKRWSAPDKGEMQRQIKSLIYQT